MKIRFSLLLTLSKLATPSTKINFETGLLAINCKPIAENFVVLFINIRQISADLGWRLHLRIKIAILLFRRTKNGLNLMKQIVTMAILSSSSYTLDSIPG